MPLTRQQVYRRRRLAAVVVILSVLGVAVYLPLTALAPIDGQSARVLPFAVETGPAAELSVPAFGRTGIGAIGFDGLLASGGESSPAPIASIAKIVTALVVLDEKPLRANEAGPTISFTEEDVRLYGEYLALNGKVAPVAAGLTLSQRQVIELVLIDSANNYSRSLANWAFGSEDAYVARATQWLADHSLGATTIVDSTGISPGNTSSTVDLVALGALALSHPVIDEIVSMRSTEIPGVGAVSNTNGLLGVGGVDGIKTGTLDEAGACLLFSADVPVGTSRVHVIGVVLGASDHDSLDAAVRGLLASVTDEFREVEVLSAGDPVASYSTPWGDSATAIATEDLSIIVWADAPVTAFVDARRIAIAPKNTSVGTITVVSGEQSIEVPISLGDALDGPDLWWRLTHPAAVF